MMKTPLLFCTAIFLCIFPYTAYCASTDIFIEAESCQDHNWYGPMEFKGVVSGDKILRLWNENDPGRGGYYAHFPFTIPQAGEWYIWASPSLNTSPFYWQLDNGENYRIDDSSPNEFTEAFGVSDAQCWVRLAKQELSAGEHILTIRVKDRREMLEKAYLLYLDAIIITQRDVKPNKLVRPEDVGTLLPPKKITPTPRVGKSGPPMLLGSSIGSVQQNRILASLGFSLLQTDSDHLTVNQPEPGVWNWEAADQGLKMAQAAGVDWQYFPHFNWTTDWLMKTERFVPSIGVISGRKLRCMSLWSPYLPQWFDEGYAAMAEHYGNGNENIAAFYLGIHGDFGEALYPLGYHPDEKQRFGEEGTGTADWWCGDEFARADFANDMQKKFGTLDKLNTVWGTNFASWDTLEYPALHLKDPETLTPQQRHRWLDFHNWYHDSMTEFTAVVARIARKHFPETRLVLPVGNGDESLWGGCDLSALTKICQESNVEMRSTHGGFQPVQYNLSTMLRRLASASDFYGINFWSEPPSTTSPDGQVGRIFESLSCRASGFWDWNPVNSQDVFRKYKNFLTQEDTVCDVALLFPTMDHRLRNNQGYPAYLREVGSLLRSGMDFDIYDELLIEDGALKNSRVAVLMDGAFLQPQTMEALTKWVKRGGVLVTTEKLHMTIDNDASLWSNLTGISVKPAPKTGSMQNFRVINTDFLSYTGALAEGKRDLPLATPPANATILATLGNQPAVWARPVGDGWVIVCPLHSEQMDLFCQVVRDVVYHLPALDPTKKAGIEVAPDAMFGKVYTVLLKSGEVIAYNSADSGKTLTILGKSVTIAPHSLLSVK